MSNLHCLISGASDGIGKQVAKMIVSLRLCSSLCIHGRNAEKLAKVATEIIEEAKKVTDEKILARPEVELTTVIADFSSLESVSKMADEVISKFPKMNCLINNAGIMASKFQRTADGFESTFGVNHLSPLLLTMKLTPLIEKNQPFRLIFVSSLGSKYYGVSMMKKNEETGEMYREGTVRDSIEWTRADQEQNFDFYQSYTLSKLLNAMVAQELHQRYQKSERNMKNIVCTSHHPGILETTLKNVGLSHIKGLAPEEGIKTMIHLLTSSEGADMKVSGKYFDDHCRIDNDWNKMISNDAERKAMFDKSISMIEDKIGAKLPKL